MILPKKKDRWHDLKVGLQLAYDFAPMNIEKIADPIENARARGKLEGLCYCLELMDELEYE